MSVGRSVFMTEDEVAVTKTALLDYQMETERYLNGYFRQVPHDPCCKKFVAFEARREEERVSLQGRLDTIIAVLDRLIPERLPEMNKE